MKIRQSRLSTFLSYLVLLAICLCTGMANAQTVTGSVTGQVTDASGAIIPNASVTVVNVDTGVKTATTSNATGVYTILFLPIGKYTLTVTAQGFSTQSYSTFPLEINQTVKLDGHLTVGAQETVQVDSSQAAILNTTDATLGSTFTTNTIENLPLNGLDFSALTLYLPGSVSTAGISGTTSIERSTYYTDTPNMNGNRAQANNYTLDGIDINETFNNLIGYSPSPESLGEVKVLTANSPADYGNVNGGGVVSVLKSGTNNYHGSIYGYDQNQKFNANSWVNNFTNQPKGAFSQTQFGGTFGGPVRIPHLFDGRDKLFFFVDYLGSRYHTGGAAPPQSLLTPAMLKGDFSALNALNIQLYDPANNYAPYTNNQVPVTNPVALFLAANPTLYPAPNQTPTDGVAKNNFVGFQRIYKANNQGDIKIEYAPDAQDRISSFFSISTAYDGKTSPLAISFPGVSLFPTKVFGTTWTHTFSSALVNSARVGYTRIVWKTGLPLDPTGQFGDTGNAKVGIPFPNQLYPGFSNQGLNNPNGSGSPGLSDFGTPAQGGGLTDNTYSYIDNLTWQRGRHLFSMGIQGIRYQNNYPTGNNYGFLGSFNYSGAFSSNPSVQNGVGYTGADFDLDRVTSEQVTLNSINVGQRQWRAAGFVQDDFKLNSRLTLNLGLRYELDEPWIESNNKTGNIDLKTGQYIYAVSVPQGAPAGSTTCSNRGCYQPNYRQLMPRLGFAYQIDPRLVVRGGYGATSFYESNSSNQRLTSITPFIVGVNTGQNLPTGTTPGTFYQVENGFPAATSSSASGSVNIYPQNIQPAYVQEFNLTVEYALTKTASLQAGYIGEKGDHIEDYGNVNQQTNLSDPTSAPYYNNTFLNVGNGSLLITESRAISSFSALEAVLRQRLHNGLEFTLNYTYGSAKTNSLGNYALNVSGYGGAGAFQNYYDPKADFGPAGYDVRNNVSATAVYSLPVGHGKTFLPNSNRLVDEAIGGWKLSTAVVGYSGFPDTVTGPGNNSQNEGGNYRANQYRKLKIVGRSPINWFGTDPSATPCTTPGVDNGVCAFGAADTTHFGTSRNGAVRGPGYFNADLSAFKDFRTYREQVFTFRYDLFNAFNIVGYGNPDTNVSDTTFGQIVSQESIRSTERRMQFSAKYRF